MACEAFVENAGSRCTCSLNVSEASLSAKCAAAIGYVVLRLVDSTGTVHECRFSEVTQGRVQSKSKNVESCSLLTDDVSDDLRTVEMTVHAYENVFNGSSFSCTPNCARPSGAGQLATEIIGIPIKFCKSFGGVDVVEMYAYEMLTDLKQCLINDSINNWLIYF